LFVNNRYAEFNNMAEIITIAIFGALFTYN
jgi:hypothetical protein